MTCEIKVLIQYCAKKRFQSLSLSESVITSTFGLLGVEVHEGDPKSLMRSFLILATDEWLVILFCAPADEHEDDGCGAGAAPDVTGRDGESPLFLGRGFSRSLSALCTLSLFLAAESPLRTDSGGEL